MLCSGRDAQLHVSRQLQKFFCHWLSVDEQLPITVTQEGRAFNVKVLKWADFAFGTCKQKLILLRNCFQQRQYGSIDLGFNDDEAQMVSWVSTSGLGESVTLVQTLAAGDCSGGFDRVRPSKPHAVRRIVLHSSAFSC